MNYRLDFGPVIDGFPALLWGCVGTLRLALGGIAFACGIVAGLAIALGRMSGYRVADRAKADSSANLMLPPSF